MQHAWSAVLRVASVCLAALYLVLGTAGAVHALEAPALTRGVTDLAGLLTPAEQQALESKLRTHKDATQQELALLIVPSLEGDPIEDFAIRVVEKTKLGQKKVDDGLLMVIAVADRKTRIEVGYGLEGEIPDAFANQIVDEVLKPAFRQDAYAAGINQAFDMLLAKANGIAVQMPKRKVRQNAGGGAPFLILLIVLFIIGSKLFGGGRRRGALGFISGFMLGGGGRGGGGGGGGGGGWGGGGGFGGGGASGDW